MVGSWSTSCIRPPDETSRVAEVKTAAVVLQELHTATRGHSSALNGDCPDSYSAATLHPIVDAPAQIRTCTEHGVPERASGVEAALRVGQIIGL